MLYTKIQPQSFLGSGEEHFQEFLPYMDMAAILFNCAEPFERIGNTFSTEGIFEIWWKLLKLFQKKTFKNYTILYIYHYENTPIQIYRKISSPKTENFQIKIHDIIHVSAQNIDCGYSLEPPRIGGSNEYPQSKFWAEIRKIMYTPVNPSFTI